MHEIRGLLYGLGPQPWHEILAMMTECRAAWGDLDGMHLAEPVPATVPAYTHLWAWRSGVCARVRIDPPAERHVVALLAIGNQAVDVATTPVPVTIDVLPVVGWSGYERVQLPDALASPNLERLVPRGHALTFIRCAEGA